MVSRRRCILRRRLVTWKLPYCWWASTGLPSTRKTGRGRHRWRWRRRGGTRSLRRGWRRKASLGMTRVGARVATRTTRATKGSRAVKERGTMEMAAARAKRMVAAVPAVAAAAALRCGIASSVLMPILWGRVSARFVTRSPLQAFVLYRKIPWTVPRSTPLRRWPPPYKTVVKRCRRCLKYR